MSERAKFGEFAEQCECRVVVPLERRPGNALNLEVGTPAARCRMLTPVHWKGASAFRWLASGGSPLVLGQCERRACPLLRGGAA